MILLHGLGGWHINFLPLIQWSHLDRRHNIVAFDLPGLGLSPKGKQQPSIEYYVQILKELVDYLDPKMLNLIGHDLGGLVATTFAAKYPDAVSSLCRSCPSMVR